MGQQTSANHTNEFKELYGADSESMKALLNDKAVLFSSYKSSGKINDRGVKLPVVMEYDEAAGAMNELEAFRTSEAETIEAPVVYPKQVGANGRISERLITLGAQGSDSSFENTFDGYVRRKQRVFACELERQWLGSGNGTMTLVNGAVSGSTTFVVDNPHVLRPGMYIDVIQSIGGTYDAQNVRISNVNANTSTVTVASAVTLTNDALVGRAGIFDAAPTDGKEITGMLRQYDTTSYGNTYLGVSRVTYQQWQSNVVNFNSTDISQDGLSQLYNRVLVISGEEPTDILSNHGQMRKMINTEIQKTQYTSQDIKAGATSLKWGTTKWTMHRYVDPGTVFMYAKSYIKKYQANDPDTAMDRDGAVLSRVGGYPLYEFAFLWFGNAANFDPRTGAKGINLNEPTF